MPRFFMLSLVAAMVMAASFSSPAGAAPSPARTTLDPAARTSVFRMPAQPRPGAAGTEARTSEPGAGARAFAAPAGATTAPDGAGGTYIAWASDRDGVSDIYLQRVTINGNVAAGWPAGGLAVCTAPGIQMDPGLISDGGTGVFMGWADFRDYPFSGDVGYVAYSDLYIQKVSAAGVPQWTANGVRVLQGVSLNGGIGVAADGSGGVFFTWGEGWPGSIVAQHVDDTGALSWATNGVIVCGYPGAQYSPVVVPGSGGASFVAWQDERGAEVEVYAQYLDAAGAPQWTADGISITGGNEGYEPSVCSDGAGGMLVFWITKTGLMGQRYNTAGLRQWAPGDKVVGTGTAFTTSLSALSDGAGGAYLSWREQYISTTLLAQHVSSAGAQTWTSGGVAFCSQPGFRFIDDGYVEAGGGLTLLWQDGRNGHGELYAQKLDAAGAAQWTADGVLVNPQIDLSRSFGISTDGAGGALAVWISYDLVDPAPRAQHLNNAGAIQFGPFGKFVVQDTGRRSRAMVAPDGTGGTWIVWHEKVSGDYQIYADHINSSGVSLLSGDLLVCNAQREQILAGVVADGAGGIVVGWQDDRTVGQRDLYAQRISSGGTALWAANGVVVCGASGNQTDMRMVSDGAGSVICTWADERFGASDIYAQRLDTSGAPLWAANGVVVSTLAMAKFDPVIAPSGSNGAVIVWNSGSAYGQRLDGNGAPQWTADGYELEGSITGFWNECVDAVSDLNDGAVVLFQRNVLDIINDGSLISSELRVLHVDDTGTSTWTSDGVLLSDFDSRRERARIVSDDAGGAIVAWSQQWLGLFDIYAQHVNSAGALQWGASGTPICNATSWQWLTALYEDVAGGAVLAWTDERNGYPDVYAQRVNASGTPQWTANGVQVTGAARGQYDCALYFAGGNTVLAWTDYRSGTERQIYTQKLNSSGVPQWTADGVTDALFSMVAAEAGPGRVRVTWAVGSAVSEVAAYRRGEGEAVWASLSSLPVDGTGRAVLEDAAVEAGGRYVYRIGLVVDGRELFSDEVHIEVPSALALAIESVAPQPARGDVWVTFTLPVLAPARLEVLDVAGRRMASREMLGLAPGRHVLRVDEVPEAGGVYFVRVWQGGESVSGRVVRVR